MTEKVYVNHNTYPVSVNLKSGSGYMLAPNEAIAGDHFFRVAQAGVLTVIGAMPEGYEPTKIHNPEGVTFHGPKEESQVQEGDSVQEEAAFREEPVVSEAPQSSESEVPREPRIHKVGVSASSSAAAQMSGGGVPKLVEEDIFLGKTKEQWVKEFNEASTESLAEQYSINNVRDIVDFLGLKLTGGKLGLINNIKEAYKV